MPRVQDSQRGVHPASGQEGLPFPVKKEGAHVDDEPFDEGAADEDIGPASQDMERNVFTPGPAKDV